MGTFELIATRFIVVKEGWGVDVCPIYDDNDTVSEIVVSTCHIVQENCTEVWRSVVYRNATL